MPDTPVDILTRWEDSGAVWRVESLTDDRAVIQLCACTGEPVDRLESGDDELLRFLSDRGGAGATSHFRHGIQPPPSAL
jgi:hypothetical protein